jgi:hypothetical protein
MDRLKYLLPALMMAFFVSGCSSVRPDPRQSTFVSGEEACAALTDAAKKNDTKRLMEIFGPEGKDIVFSGDEKLDAESRGYFAKTAEEKIAISQDGDNCYTVELGDESFPFAVPLSKYDGRWFFNTPAGLDELINRRIGRNEIFTIKVCEALSKTEVERARLRTAAGGACEFAMNLAGGNANSQYWNADSKSDENLICPALANAALEPGNPERKPYYGYYYKVLKAQGPAAPGGRKSYLVDGKLKNGFAILAYPAKYGDLGIKSFIVSKCGVIFEKDLGDDTDKYATGMLEYNPDDSWDPVRD